MKIQFITGRIAFFWTLTKEQIITQMRENLPGAFAANNLRGETEIMHGGRVVATIKPLTN